MPRFETRPLRVAGWSAVCLIAWGCDAPALPLDMGIPWELAEHRQATISELSYRISLDIPAVRDEPIGGRSLISLQWNDRDRQPLVLDFMNPGERVASVRVNGTDALWEPVNDHVVIAAAALSKGFNEIELRYTAGDEALNRNDDFLYALFVPDRAHFSLPVFDQPNLKATVGWEVQAPASWKVVANGPALERTILGDRATTRFLDTRPIPTYLFAVAAGVFTEESAVVDNRVLRMFHRETDPEKVERNRDEIFELHGRALAWLEDYTGIDYPFQKFEFVLIPSFQYGGMEHPGGILYRGGGLMLDETATQGQILGRASVIAHETAHMWFGDLVTMNWFDDVWTKEVFANFMAAKIVEPSFPELNHDLRFLSAHQPTAYDVDRTDGANPIRQPLDNLREAGTLYGAIIYQKAPVVMRHLETRVGAETFRDGLREYLNRFSYGNATWPDLIEILDARSPQDLSAWSRVWVEEAGRPRIIVRREGPDAWVRQEDPAGAGRVWPQTLGIRIGSVERDSVVTVELGEAEVRLGGAGGAEYVLPNGMGIEYGDFVLDEQSQEYIVTRVSDFQPALVRGAAWVTLWDQVLDGRLAPGRFLSTALSALESEDDELALGRILGYVGQAFWGYLSEDDRAAVAERLEQMLWQGATSKRPTTARAAFYGSYRGSATTAEGVARLRRLWAGEERLEGLPLSENDRVGLASGLALRGVPDAESILDQQEGRTANPDRLARFRFVRPSLSADPAVRAAFFESLRDPENRATEPWALEGLGNIHHPLRAESSLELIRPALDMIEEIQRTGDIFFPGRWLDATLGGHGSVAAAEVVDRFLVDRADLPPRLTMKVLQSADGVRRSAAIVHGWESSR